MSYTEAIDVLKQAGQEFMYKPEVRLVFLGRSLSLRRWLESAKNERILFENHHLEIFSAYPLDSICRGGEGFLFQLVFNTAVYLLVFNTAYLQIIYL